MGAADKILTKFRSKKTKIILCAGPENWGKMHSDIILWVLGLGCFSGFGRRTSLLRTCRNVGFR